uniref:Uncharacterized protein n=1 Tax=Cryptomonas curvata TaxID=233186 RepID=A0A7S0QQU6_9CRYP|mmetsp:Transcript_45867/g.96070  ORF Transcript_45867/g.96070 Transcript_45867/m.96070 type:complete len:147 (+) Transcript_45867:251-691(+)
MNLCMTELRGLGSNLFANPQGMVTTELVKRTNVDFVAANVPAKRPATATNQIQTQKAVHEPRPSPLPPSSNLSATNSSSNSSANQLSRVLSDPKRVQDKMKQKHSMQQAITQRRICLYTVADCPHFDNVQIVPTLPSLRPPRPDPK